MGCCLPAWAGDFFRLRGMPTQSPWAAHAADVDRNGLADLVVLEKGGFLLSAQFVRGDVNADSACDVADAITILTYLYGNGKEPDCLALPPPVELCGDDPTGDDGLDCAAFRPCQ